jgi:hypothetical protein
LAQVLLGTLCALQGAGCNSSSSSSRIDVGMRPAQKLRAAEGKHTVR